MKPTNEKKKGAKKEPTKLFKEAVEARVEEIVGRTGMKGEITQVRCKVLGGRDQNKVLRRNVKGPIKPGDLLMLRETEIEARRIGSKGK
jgi:small subunit ribosomal protein S28e